MTSALARRCAGISQLRHTGLPWSALPPTSELPDNPAGSEARSSGDRRSVSFSDASSNRSSQEVSLVSRGLGYRLADLGHQGLLPPPGVGLTTCSLAYDS